MNYATIIKEIGRGTKGARDMSREDAHTLFSAVLAGEVPDMELGAILLALRIKGESHDELAGFKDAMDSATAHITAPKGARCVVLPTYNGARKQPNLMPLLAQLLAREGVPVLIQGRHDFDTRISPFELLAALDIHCATSLAEAETQLAERKLSVLSLAQLNPGLDRLLELRPRLGVRNSGHSLAKLLDPCPQRSVRVVAVTHPPYMELMERHLAEDLGVAMLMRGTEGEAFANPRRRPRMLGMQNGEVHEIYPQADGHAELPDADCSVLQNAQLIRQILNGDLPVPEPITEQVDALVKLAQA